MNNDICNENFLAGAMLRTLRAPIGANQASDGARIAGKSPGISGGPRTWSLLSVQDPGARAGWEACDVRTGGWTCHEGTPD